MLLEVDREAGKIRLFVLGRIKVSMGYVQTMSL